jgi:hypothetical protein
LKDHAAMTDALEQSRSKPWNDGGKEAFLGSRCMTMTHDELAARLGDAYHTIEGAGFVIVPRVWRDDALAALERNSKSE